MIWIKKVDNMNESIKEKIKNLLNEQRFAVIATQDHNETYTNLVSFYAENTLNKIYFPTLKNTKKFKNLSTKSRISILFDNRGNNPQDITNAITVTAIGNTKEIHNSEIISCFLKKHPYLSDFIHSSDCILIQIDVEKFIFVDHFQNVNVIEL